MYIPSDDVKLQMELRRFIKSRASVNAGPRTTVLELVFTGKIASNTSSSAKVPNKRGKKNTGAPPGLVVLVMKLEPTTLSVVKLITDVIDPGIRTREAARLLMKDIRNRTETAYCCVTGWDFGRG